MPNSNYFKALDFQRFLFRMEDAARAALKAANLSREDTASHMAGISSSVQQSVHITRWEEPDLRLLRIRARTIALHVYHLRHELNARPRKAA